MHKRTLFYIIAFTLCIVCSRAQSNVDTKIYVNSQTDDKTFVLIIANEDYKHEESVPFAKNDGEVFKIYCQKTLGIPESNISLVTNATLNEINYEVDHLGEVLDAYDGTARAIVYYTGHGMPDEKDMGAYLLPVDGYSKSPSSGISTKSFYDKLRGMKSSQIIVFLDACFSGARRDGKMLTSSRGVLRKAKLEPVGDNTVVFSAAQGDETAFPYSSMHHGMFTYFMLDKMQKSGGYTTLGELSEYVTQQVKQKSVVVNKKRQTPSVTVSTNNKNWRNWRFASTAAKKYETRSAAPASTPKPAQTTAASKPATNNTATAQSASSSAQPARRTETPVQTASAAPAPVDNATLSSLVNQGKKAMRAMNYDSAKRNFLQAANQGSVEANYQLGMLYSNSNYDGYNKEMATGYFLKAANANYVEAMYQAGMMYLGSDNATAKTWLRRAANKGHSRAQAQLSRLR